MKTIFNMELKRTRKGLFLWCFVITLTAVMGLLEYPFISKYIDLIEPALASIPKVVQIMFGVYKVDFHSPIGYFVCMCFWCCLIIYSHAVYMGSSIVLKDQRDKITEYLFTKPYKRDTIILAKILVVLVNLFIIAFVTGIFMLITLMQMDIDQTILVKAATVVCGIFFTQLVLASIGFLCSAICKTYKLSVISSIGSLIIMYIIAIVIEYAEYLNIFNFLSPIRYFHANSIVMDGIHPAYLLISAIVIGLSLYISFVFYRKKEFCV